MKIVDHRLVGDVNHTSTKKHGRVILPQIIVMHYTAGWSHSGAVFTLSKGTRKASAHVDVGRTGGVTQIVDFNVRAWHAGPSRFKVFRGLNKSSIGIEQDNIGPLQYKGGLFIDNYGNHVTEEGEVRNRSGRTTMKLDSGPQDWLKQRHPVHGNRELFWEPYSDELLATSEKIVKLLIEEYPIKYIISHEICDTRGWKSDPGPAFPMEHFQSLLNPNAESTIHQVKTIKTPYAKTPLVYQINADGIIARRKPDPLSDPVGTEFPKWRELNVYGVKDGWAYVKWWDADELRLGYVPVKHLEQKSEENVTKAPKPKRAKRDKYRATVGSLRIRTGPANSFPVIGNFKKDAVVTVKAFDNGWGRIEFTNNGNTVTGWTYGKYLERTA